LELAGLSAVGTIERWLLPQPEPVAPPEDPATELRRLIRQLTQAPDREAAANLWTSGATLASRLAETGVIPASRQHEDCKALEDNDWQQVQASLESLEESVRPCPAKRSRLLPTPNSVSYCVEEMGPRFISDVLGHRPYCRGLRWKRCDVPPSGGLQINNRYLAYFLSLNLCATIGDTEWMSLGLASPLADSFVCSRDEGEAQSPQGSAGDMVYFRRVPEAARETRFLCSINAPSQTRIKELIELWDRGHHLALREELMRGSDFILTQTTWWPSTPCSRQHGWWMRTVDSITLTQCLGCSGMVQTSSLDAISKTCPSCRLQVDPPKRAPVTTPSETPFHFRPPRGGRRRSKRPVSPGSDMEPYSALRPLDQARPEELAGEGWGSDDDWDNRGLETCLSPPPATPPRRWGMGRKTVRLTVKREVATRHNSKDSVSEGKGN
jgi:hypothetical protein